MSRVNREKGYLDAIFTALGSEYNISKLGYHRDYSGFSTIVTIVVGTVFATKCINTYLSIFTTKSISK